MASKKTLSCEGDKQFFCADGQVCNSPKKLITAIRKMPKETFQFHSQPDDNHFANWVEHVFKKKKEADMIRNGYKTKKAVTCVLKKIC